MRYSFASNSCIIAAYYYIHQAVRKDPRLAPSSLSVHRLFITAVVLAAKYFDDVAYNLSYYAKVGGLAVSELAYLELKMLTVLDFRLHISASHFHTLEQDMLTDVISAHETPLVAQAKSIIQHAPVCMPRFTSIYCETMHDDDRLGLWLPHPTPKQRVLQCVIERFGVASPPSLQSRVFDKISRIPSTSTFSDISASDSYTSSPLADVHIEKEDIRIVRHQAQTRPAQGDVPYSPATSEESQGIALACPQRMHLQSHICSQTYSYPQRISAPSAV